MSELSIHAGAVAEDPKPYKRPYKKSVAGCRSCKARKIKCGEERPVCANCKKRFANISSCEYSTAASRASRKVSVDPISSGTPPAGAVILEQQISFKPFKNNSADRFLELRLFHHFTKNTCQGNQCVGSMVPISRYPMWETEIPQIAFSSPIVLDALMGISALHLLALEPHDRSLAVISKSYFNRAVIQQKDALSTINSQNAQSLLMAAILIAHYTWLRPHISDGMDERYQVNLDTHQMCGGVRALIIRASPWLKKYDWFEGDDTDLDDSVCSTGFMKSAMKDLAMLSAHFRLEGVSEEDADTYEKVAEELVLIYDVIGAGLDTTRSELRTASILHRVPTHFQDLLKKEDPLSIALLARSYAVLSFFEDSKAWWLHGAGEHKVCRKTVLGMCGLMPPEWIWSMEWPMKVISKEVTLDVSRVYALHETERFKN